MWSIAVRGRKVSGISRKECGISQLSTELWITREKRDKKCSFSVKFEKWPTMKMTEIQQED